MVAHPQFVALVPGAQVIDDPAVGIRIHVHIDGGVFCQDMDAFVESATHVVEVTHPEGELLQAIHVGRIFEGHVDGTPDVLRGVAVLTEDLLR